MTKYAIGLDFGTQSVRSAIIDINNGDEVFASIHKYKNGVIDTNLPDSNITCHHSLALNHHVSTIEPPVANYI